MTGTNPYLQVQNAYATAHQTLPKSQQIVMLYDGMIRFVTQAKQAIEERDIETRYQLLAKTSDIIMGLQGSLDFDQGEEVAQILYDYYSRLDAKIFQVQRQNDAACCDMVIDDLKQMREVWSGLAGAGTVGDADDTAVQQAAPVPSPASDESSGFQFTA